MSQLRPANFQLVGLDGTGRSTFSPDGESISSRAIGDKSAHAPGSAEPQLGLAEEEKNAKLGLGVPR